MVIWAYFDPWLYSCWKAVSMNGGCMFLSTVSPLVEAYFVRHRAFSISTRVVTICRYPHDTIRIAILGSRYVSYRDTC